MAGYSAFAPYGLQSYSSRATAAERIYGSIVTAEGGAYAHDGPHGAWVYATAMATAIAQAHLDLAKNQQDPAKASVLLAQLEADRGLVAVTGATDQERRDRLELSRKLGWGARLGSITDGLRAILGDAVLGLRLLGDGESQNAPGDEWTDSSSYFAPPTVTRKVVRFNYNVSNLGLTDIGYDLIGGAREPLQKGDIINVEPGRWGLAERIVVEEALTTTAVRLYFQRPHQAPFFATTACVPAWSSTRRHMLVVVTRATLDNAEVLKRIDGYLSDVAQGTATWLITFPVDDSYEGHPYQRLGPFMVQDADNGLIGITPIAGPSGERWGIIFGE
jgi:hypothetical protein